MHAVFYRENIACTIKYIVSMARVVQHGISGASYKLFCRSEHPIPIPQGLKVTLDIFSPMERGTQCFVRWISVKVDCVTIFCAPFTKTC